MRFGRREMVFDKGEISKKTANVAEINEKRRPCTGARRTPGHGDTIPIIGGRQLPSDDGVRGGRGALFGCRPSQHLRGSCRFRHFDLLFDKGNVRVSACKMWERVKNRGGKVVGA